MATNTDADAYAQGRQGIFFQASDNNTLNDGNLTGQCVSLVKWFLAEMTSVPNPGTARGHAKSFGDQLVAEGHADRVGSPQRGDIVVWPSDGGPYGHIGVVLSGGRVFEQNVGVAGTAKRIVHGLTVYAARISPLYANWRKGSPVFYRVRSYVENTTKQGEQLMIIQNAENWYQRCNRTHWQIRGRELDRSTFQAFVGQDFLKFVEVCSDDPEAETVQSYQTTGRVAVTDRWDQQIFTLQDEVAALSKRPTAAQLDSLNAQIKSLTDSAAEAKAQAEKAAEATPTTEPITQPASSVEAVQEEPVSPVKPATPTEAMKSASLFVARIGSQIAAARIIAEGIAVSLNGQIAGLVSGSLVGWMTIAIAALLIFWAQFGYQLAQSAGWKWAANLKWPF